MAFRKKRGKRCRRSRARWFLSFMSAPG
jgi:hypothetical protein